MVLDFNKLPEDARVWIYQSNRAFTAGEVAQIEEELAVFVAGWTHHGDALNGAFVVKYNQFIILGIDENTTGASGCSIDSSVFFIKQMEKKFNVQLLDRMQTAFRGDNDIEVVSLARFNDLVKDTKITENTTVFNNLVATKGVFDSQWEVAAKMSWHKRYFN
ncbi:MAG: ABC transporter ATPase [Flavobacteriaceae bacterium]|nr:ABC transporter ATPase [Flavobacteriaceae bacterium]